MQTLMLTMKWHVVVVTAAIVGIWLLGGAIVAAAAPSESPGVVEWDLRQPYEQDGIGVQHWAGPLALVPDDPDSLLVDALGDNNPTNRDGLYSSHDAGLTYEYLGKVDPDETMSVLVFNPVSPTIVLAGFERSYYQAGIYRSEDQGVHWTSVLPNFWVNDIEIDPGNPQVAYAAVSASGAPPTVQPGVYKSEDTGKTWDQISDEYFSDIAVDPATPTTLYGARSGVGVFRSTNGGEDWDPLATFDGLGQSHILVDKNNPERLYAFGRSYGGIYRSDNSGLDWDPISDNLPSGDDYSVLSAALDPTTPDSIWIGVQYLGIFHSSDAGESWSPVNEGLDDGSYCSGISLAANGRHAIDCELKVYVRAGFSTREDESAKIQYDGWRGKIDPNASGGAYRISKKKDDKISFNFKGTKVEWVSLRGPDQGQAGVFIDGVDKGVFDQYKPSPVKYQTARPFGGLADGKHTIVIQVLGSKDADSTGKNIVVDGFIVGGATKQEDARRVHFNKWKARAAQDASGGSYRGNGNAGSFALFRFKGRSVQWVTAVGPGYQYAQIWIDGVQLDQPVSLYADTQQWQKVFRFSGLKAGKHTIMVKPLGEPVVVDAFRSLGE